MGSAIYIGNMCLHCECPYFRDIYIYITMQNRKHKRLKWITNVVLQCTYAVELCIPFNSSPLVPHICVSESGQHIGSDNGACRLFGANYLNQCSLIVNSTLRKKLQWNKIFRWRKYIWKRRLWNGGHFVQGGDEWTLRIPLKNQDSDCMLC